MARMTKQSHHHLGYDRTIAAIAALLTLCTLMLRVPFMAEYLFEGDSVNFAFALHDFNPAEIRPHPPGYTLYVALGALMRTIIPDDNTALIAASILLSGAAVVATFLLGSVMFSRQVGLAASLLLLTAPFFWFYGEVALTYSGSAAFGSMLAFGSYHLLTHKGRSTTITTVILNAVLGISAGLRPDIALFMTPLVLYSTWKQRGGIRIFAVAAIAGTTGVLAWLLPMLHASGGYSTYASASSSQFQYYVSKYSVLFGNPITTHLLMVKNLVLVLGGATAFLLPGFLFAARKDSLLRTPSAQEPNAILFFSLWILPGLAWLAFVYFDAFGYVMTFLPAFFLLAASGYARLLSGASGRPSEPVRFWTVISLAALLQTALFFSPSPIDFSNAIGRTFREKSMGDSILSGIYTAFLRHRYETITEASGRTRAFVNGVAQLNLRPSETVILAFHRSAWGAGQMMYYLPHYPVYMLADWREDMEKVRFGQYGRTIEDLSTNNIVYPSNTKTVVVFCSEDSPTYEVLRRQNPLERIAIPGDLYFFLARSPNTRFEVGGFLFSNGSRGKNDRE